MKKVLLIAIVLISFEINGAEMTDESNNFFYCGITLKDGTGQDYVKWGKGTDFIFNESTDRWEWVTEFTYQYIYPDGTYEQIARVNFFDDEVGVCNDKMEAIYNQQLAELLK